MYSLEPQLAWLNDMREQVISQNDNSKMKLKLKNNDSSNSLTNTRDATIISSEKLGEIPVFTEYDFRAESLV